MTEGHFASTYTRRYPSSVGIPRSDGSHICTLPQETVLDGTDGMIDCRQPLGLAILVAISF